VLRAQRAWAPAALHCAHLAAAPRTLGPIGVRSLRRCVLLALEEAPATVEQAAQRARREELVDLVAGRRPTALVGPHMRGMVHGLETACVSAVEHGPSAKFGAKSANGNVFK